MRVVDPERAAVSEAEPSSSVFSGFTLTALPSPFLLASAAVDVLLKSPPPKEKIITFILYIYTL